MEMMINSAVTVSLVINLVSFVNGDEPVNRLISPTYWGPWSQWSSCSSQCGQGVSTMTRDCLQWNMGKTNRGLPWQCDGYGMRKRVCYEECVGMPTHKPLSWDECSFLNLENSRSIKDWTQMKLGYPCRVVCRSHSNNNVRTIRLKKNKSTCKTHRISEGECIGGLCHPVKVIDDCLDIRGRPRPVDKCLVCGGDNTACDMVDGTYRISSVLDPDAMSTLVQIPPGSTSIQIMKYGKDVNTLALVDSSNGDVINDRDWPNHEGSLQIDGITWSYAKNISYECITSAGPMPRATTAMLTFPYPRQVIFYSYWVPKYDGPFINKEVHNAPEHDHATQTTNKPINIESTISTTGLEPLDEDAIWEFLDSQRHNQNERETTTATATTSTATTTTTTTTTTATSTTTTPWSPTVGHSQEDHDISIPETIQKGIKILGEESEQPKIENLIRLEKKKTKKDKDGRRPNDVYVSLKPNEYCYPCIRAKDKARQFCNSDFVSKVHINRRKVIGNETRFDATILASYRNRVRMMPREYIWLESTCRCPRLRAKRTYIIMGHQQSMSDRVTRLVITPKSYIRGFSAGSDRKIRKLNKNAKCCRNINGKYRC